MYSYTHLYIWVTQSRQQAELPVERESHWLLSVFKPDVWLGRICAYWLLSLDTAFFLGFFSSIYQPTFFSRSEFSNVSNIGKKYSKMPPSTWPPSQASSSLQQSPWPQSQASPSFRQTPCHQFARTGVCRFGNRCKYTHDGATPALNQPQCRPWPPTVKDQQARGPIPIQPSNSHHQGAPRTKGPEARVPRSGTGDNPQKTLGMANVSRLSRVSSAIKC